VPVDTPPLFHGSLEQTWPWLAFIVVQLAFAGAVIFAVSRASVGTWWGKSEKPVFVRDASPATLAAALETEGPRRIKLRQGL
jgi:hypothetical protein